MSICGRFFAWSHLSRERSILLFIQRFIVVKPSISGLFDEANYVSVCLWSGVTAANFRSLRATQGRLGQTPHPSVLPFICIRAFQQEKGPNYGKISHHHLRNLHGSSSPFIRPRVRITSETQ